MATIIGTGFTVYMCIEKKEGPLGLLYDCYTQQKYVQVWIRHSRGLRGVCQGKLLAFDHHLNLVSIS